LNKKEREYKIFSDVNKNLTFLPTNSLEQQGGQSYFPNKGGGGI